jgi:hypothetical protein
MMAVPVRATPTVELGTPVALFASANRRWVSFDVSPDGKRFLVIVPEIVANEKPLTALLNLVPGLAGSRGHGFWRDPRARGRDVARLLNPITRIFVTV